MQKKFLLISLLFIYTNLFFAQKKEKIVIETPPPASVLLSYSSYVWVSEKKDHSINVLEFEPYSENVELISKTKDLQEINKEKFIYSVTDSDVMILKNHSKKIILKITTENNPTKLINTKTKEIFIRKMKEGVKEPSLMNPIYRN